MRTTTRVLRSVAIGVAGAVVVGIVGSLMLAVGAPVAAVNVVVLLGVAAAGYLAVALAAPRWAPGSTADLAGVVVLVLVAGGSVLLGEVPPLVAVAAAVAPAVGAGVAWRVPPGAGRATG